MVIRLQVVGNFNNQEQMEGIVELQQDLPSPDHYMEYNGGQYNPGPGSLFYCCEDALVHIRMSDLEWAVGGEAYSSSETEEDDTPDAELPPSPGIQEET